VAEVVLRAPTLDDVDAVVDVINRASRGRRGRDEVDAKAVRGWWTQPPPFDPATDAVVAIRGGEIVGYGDIGDQANDGSVLWLDVRGAAGRELHDELERRALARRSADGVIRAVVDENDADLAALLAERGYHTIRSSYRMGIDLPGASIVARWPSGATVRSAVEGVDEPLLHRLGEESFADHWGHTPSPYDEWLHWLRNLGTVDPSLWLIAEAHGVPAGLAICRPSAPGDEDCGWVSVLGVLREHRRAGLGTALLATAFTECQRRGRLRAELGVDAESTTGAVRLYERAGMRVLWRWDIWERSPSARSARAAAIAGH
jgi:ribosomal protein S18 acetylase RimI-like enzyme